MNDIVVVAGPTAVGKTEYAIEIAKSLDGEIVSADSMQIYKYMDIGSAKPTEDEQSQVKHWLVDEIDPRDRFTVYEYQVRAKEYIKDILSRGKTPIISGGTGLYISSLIYKMDFAGENTDLELRKELEKLSGDKLHEMLSELDSEAAERIHPNNIKKMIRAIESVKLSGTRVKSFDKAKEPTDDYSFTLIGLIRDREELYDRINRRVDILFDLGLVDEVGRLMEMGLTSADISMKGIGYKEVIAYLEGKYGLEEAKELIKKSTRHYAKKQLTWMRSYNDIRMFNLSTYESKEDALGEIVSWLKNDR